MIILFKQQIWCILQIWLETYGIIYTVNDAFGDDPFRPGNTQNNNNMDIPSPISFHTIKNLQLIYYVNVHGEIPA